MASQRIKGITIEIGGDTTQLTKALSSVDKAVKETQSNLRDINKALKFDTGNVDLLKTKQELLNDSVKQAEDKLKAEKDALDQLKRTDGFDANSKAAKDLQTQIALDEVELKKAQQELKNFGSVGKQQMQLVSKKIQDVGSKVSKVGQSLTKYVTGPIVGLGAASVAAWNEVDSAMDIVITKTGATGEALADMQERVSSIATTIPTSFEEAGTAIGEVNTRFGLTGDALEELSTKFIQFATINGTDVNSSIDTVQKALNAFGLEAKDAGAVLDTLNKVGQDTGISMDTLGSLLISNATAFQGFGLNIADAATLLGKLEKSGIDTSVVITGLSKVQKEAAEQGISMQDALNLALTDVGSAIDVFGSKAGVKLYESFSNGTLAVDDFVTSTQDIDGALGSVSDTYEATLDPLDQMTTIMNQFKDIGADIVNTSGPMLVEIMAQLADTAKTLSDAWNQLTPAQKESAVQMAAAVAILPPIITAIGSVVSIFGKLLPILVEVGGTIAEVVGPALAGISAPVAIAIAAVVALGAAIAYCVVHWEQIKEVATKVADEIAVKWTEFKAKMSELLTDIVSKAKEKWEEFKTNTVNSWNNTANSIKTTANNIKTNVTTTISGLVTDAVSKFNKLKQDAINIFENIKSSISNSVSNIKNTIVNGFENAVSYIKSLPGQALSWGADIINGIVNGIKSAIGNITSVMSDVASTIAGFIHFSEPDVGPLKNFHTFMPDMMRQLAQGIENGIPTLENAMDSMTQHMVPAIGAGNTTTTTTNSVNINVYGAQGQDVSELAEIVQQKIIDNTIRQGVVFA